MTDLDEFKAFYNKYGIGYSEFDYNGEKYIRTDEGSGYTDFTFEARFTPEGKFKDYAVIE